MAENKKEITVDLYVKEIIFGVQNKTYKTGQAREAESKKGYEAASNMKASDDDDDDYEIRRSLATHFSELKSVLGEYLDENASTSDNLINEEIDRDGKLELRFRLPSNFNKASVDALGKGIHHYLVSRVVADWFLITDKEDATDYVATAEAGLENVKKALYKRSRPERPTIDKNVKS